MIRSKRGLITIGTFVLILGLIILMPARVAVHWLAPADIAISGIHGTAWRGGANEVSVYGVYLRHTKWRLSPLRLLTGKLSYRIETTPVTGFIESDIDIGFGGTMSLSNLTAALPLEMFAGATGISGLQGSASLNFKRVVIVNGLATAADGVIQVAGLVVPLVGRDSLGGYEAEFFTQNNGIAASIRDTDGVVDLAGSLQIKTDRSFAFLGQVVVKPETPQSVRRQLQFLPPPNERGQQELRLEGIL